MVEIVRHRTRSVWATLAATVTVVVAVGIVGARLGLRMVWSRAHVMGALKR